MPNSLKEGDKAPPFVLPTDNGGDFAFKDLGGKKLVLYFYPKDDTTGCTKEAIGFSERLSDFKKSGTIVLGVSKDTVEKHSKFRDKYDLKVGLGADPEGKVVERYGAWVEKSMYGRKYMGIDRSTFLIDNKGVIRKIWRKVKVPGHVDEVLKALKAL